MPASDVMLIRRGRGASSRNGNVNDSYLADGYSGPPIDCMEPSADRADLTYCEPGQNAASRLIQRTKGAGIQFTDSQDLFGWSNQAILGADYSDSRDSFVQTYQYGALNPARALIYRQNPFNDETVIDTEAEAVLRGHVEPARRPWRGFARENAGMLEQVGDAALGDGGGFRHGGAPAPELGGDEDLAGHFRHGVEHADGVDLDHLHRPGRRKSGDGIEAALLL